MNALDRKRRLDRPIIVVQIGANDGLHDDPIRHFILHRGWEGLLIEPVPSIFKSLRANYANAKGIRFENAAIGDTDGIQPFFYIDDPKDELPAWTHEVGSFFRDLVPNQVSGKDVTSYIRQIDVPCHSFRSVMAKHQLSKADVLVTDVQGFDDRIILQIPFDEIKPSIIVYESCLLDESSRARCEELLKANGYTLESDQWDTLASIAPPIPAGQS
ncbi:MAG: FkbM family methyltransferase [Verrucomicrobiae bacterium]|nr:FkbM family methyltransferase [Verrucomicrobiae bacterium]